MKYRFLGKINTPKDVKKLNISEANELCGEIRDCIIETVSKNGGHLASSLGAVELTVALHRAFDAPRDDIIFDVGHQSYAHKLITGRFDNFNSLRTEGGISGFMRPSESEYDPFVTGHSSNSISAAYGIFKAKRLAGDDSTVVAVIGDGAMTGGMAYEALNNADDAEGNFIIVLNDNEMSISKNVGSMAKAFTRLRNQTKYHKFKFAISKVLSKIPLIGLRLYHFIYLIKDAFKRLVYRNNVFVSMGFNYLGPVDGHDVEDMEALFKIAKSYSKPSLVHVVTVKGKGYSHAENMPNHYHGVSPFDVEIGATDSNTLNYSAVAGRALCDLAEKNDKICAVTAAMASGTGLTDFAARFPKRFFDVGIAEQHAVTFTAGLSKGGMIPYFAVYSSFLQRGYDQILHDAAIEKLPIKLLVDRAGIVGEDGESHQGIFDVAYLSSVPKMNIYSPCYYSELIKLINSTSQNDELAAIRYPRGCDIPNFDGDFSNEFTVVGNGGKRAIITYGRLFSNAYDAQKQLSQVDIIKLNRIFPSSECLIDALLKYDELHIFEEVVRTGCIGEQLASLLLEKGYKGIFKIHAVKDEFVPSSRVSDALKKYGLDTDSMVKTFKEE